MARKLKIELELDDHGMARALRVDKDAVVQLGDATDKAGRKVKGFGSIASVAFGQLAAQGISGLLAGISNLARRGFRLLDESVRAAGVQQIAEGKLRQALKNLGDTSEESFQKLKAGASALQDVSNFGDEATLTAQALLLSFREVGGAQGASILTHRMGDVAAGLAKVNGETVDLNNVAALLGKSLSRSASELTRVGVSLSKTQEQAFNAAEGLDKVNILAEILDDNFAGLAEATRDPFKQLTNDVGDLKEELGFQLRPQLVEMADTMRGYVKDPQVINFVRQIGQAVVETIKAAGSVFKVVSEFSAAVRAQIRLFIGKWRDLQAQVVDGALQITTTLQRAAEGLGMDGMAGKLATLNRELAIQSLGLKTMAQGERELAAQILLGNQALESRQEILGGGGGGTGGGGGGAPVAPGASAGSAEDPLAVMKARREELIKQGQITEELIRLNTQIARIEAERAFVKQASVVATVEGAHLEASAMDTVIQAIMQRKDAEMAASAATIEATKEQIAIKKELAKQEQENLSRQVEANAASALSAGSAGEAIKNSIRGIIQAKLAQLIASTLAPLGPAALVVGPLLAAGAKSLFSALVPGFATGGTVLGPPGTDNVLARLTPGEEVINARAAAENRPLLRAINSGQPASAGMGPLDINLSVNGSLSASTQEVVARLDETAVTIQATRGQIRTQRAS